MRNSLLLCRPERDIQRKQNAIISYRRYWKLSLFTFSSEKNRRRT